MRICKIGTKAFLKNAGKANSGKFYKCNSVKAGEAGGENERFKQFWR